MGGRRAFVEGCLTHSFNLCPRAHAPAAPDAPPVWGGGWVWLMGAQHTALCLVVL